MVDSIDVIGAFALRHENSLPKDAVASFSTGLVIGLQIALNFPEFTDRFCREVADDTMEETAAVASNFVEWAMQIRRDLNGEGQPLEGGG